MKKSIAILFVIALTLSACLSSPEGVTSTPQATITLAPAPTQTPTPEPALPAEVVEKGSELNKMGIPEGAKLGQDENGNPIYYVTNPAGEQVTVGQQNENGDWELADSLRYKLYATVEEAEASGVVMDTEYVLRGGPGQAAKLNGQPFLEDVLTGLNVEVVKPNWNNPYFDELNFDKNGLSMIKNNPDRAPYRNMGWFLFKNIVNGAERPGYGTVWQWTNPDGSIVYLTAIISVKPTSGYEITPFATFNWTKDASNIIPIIDEIGHNSEMNQLLKQWAETNTVPAELQDKAILMGNLLKSHLTQF